MLWIPTLLTSAQRNTLASQWGVLKVSSSWPRAPAEAFYMHKQVSWA